MLYVISLLPFYTLYPYKDHVVGFVDVCLIFCYNIFKSGTVLATLDEI